MRRELLSVSHIQVVIISSVVSSFAYSKDGDFLWVKSYLCDERSDRYDER